MAHWERLHVFGIIVADKILWMVGDCPEAVIPGAFWQELYSIVCK